MQKSETKRLDQRGTSERGKARKTARAGQRSYSKKYGKGSSQRRRRGGKANGGKKRQRGRRRQVYKISDLLTPETIEKLKEMK